MEELEILRQKLYSIQKQDNSLKLSERNCIEIIVKIIDLKMIDIIHTLNGKEYITPKHLENEIKDEILRSNGRVVIVDLQPLLSIDIIHIQECVDRIKKKDRTIQIYQGEIMTRYYLDSVVQEIQEQLNEVGKIHINDLSNRFSIGVDLLVDVIQSRLGKMLVNAVFDNQETLYTQSHIDRHCHKVIGLFSSITHPCIISHVIKQYQQQYQLDERLVRQQLQELIASKRIAGTIQSKSSHAEYIPTIFSQSRSKWIESFYNSNQFITYDSLTKLQISDPASYLKSTFKNGGVALDSTFVNQCLIDKIDDNITEVIEGSNWLDIIPLLPPLTNKDISILVGSCQNFKDGHDKVIFLGSFIISKAFVDRCFSLLQNSIQEKMEKQQKILENIASSSNTKKQQQAQQDGTTTTTTTTTTKKQIDSDDEDSGNKKPSKKGKSGKVTSPKQIDSDEEDRKSKGNKKGSNKKGGNSGKKKNDSSDDEYDYQQKSKQSNNSKGGGKVDHLQEIIQLLGKWYENMEDELVQSLSQYLRPLVNQSWETMVKEVREKLENENMKIRKQQQQQLNTQFNTLYNSFLLFKKGLSSVDQNDAKSITSLEKHLLKTIATNITNLLIEINANYHILETNTFETTAQRNSILALLPPQLAKNLDKLILSLNKSSLDDFTELLDTVCYQSQIKLKSLDKKSEKQLLQDHKNELEDQLFNGEEEIGNQFQIIVNLLYIRYKNNYIYSPPRLIGTLVSSICKDSTIDKELKSKLSNLHQEIVKSIINSKNNESDNNQDIIEVVEHFRDLIKNNQLPLKSDE